MHREQCRHCSGQDINQLLLELIDTPKLHEFDKLAAE